MIINRNPHNKEPLVTSWANIIVRLDGEVQDPATFIRAQAGDNGCIDVITQPIQREIRGSRTIGVHTTRKIGSVEIDPKRSVVNTCGACRQALQKADWWQPDYYIQNRMGGSKAVKYSQAEMQHFANVRQLS